MPEPCHGKIFIYQSVNILLRARGRPSCENGENIAGWFCAVMVFICIYED
jgi:hypothetical protein